VTRFTKDRFSGSGKTLRHVHAAKRLGCCRRQCDAPCRLKNIDGFREEQGNHSPTWSQPSFLFLARLHAQRRLAPRLYLNSLGKLTAFLRSGFREEQERRSSVNQWDMERKGSEVVTRTDWGTEWNEASNWAQERAMCSPTWRAGSAYVLLDCSSYTKTFLTSLLMLLPHLRTLSTYHSHHP